MVSWLEPPRRRRVPVEREPASYLGYPLTIGERTVVVADKTGRTLATVPSVKQARLFVRGYRRGVA